MKDQHYQFHSIFLNLQDTKGQFSQLKAFSAFNTTAPPSEQIPEQAGRSLKKDQARGGTQNTCNVI